MKNNNLFIIGAPLLSIILLGFSLFISRGIESLSLPDLLASLIGLIIVAVGNAGLLAWVITQTNNGRVNEQISSLEKGILNLATLQDSMVSKIALQAKHVRDIVEPKNNEWLYPPGYMSVETNYDGKTIWVVSPDLSNDIVQSDDSNPDAHTVGIVKDNIRRGISYTYVVPDTPLIRGRVSHLDKQFEDHPEQLRIIYLPILQFVFLPETELIVFYPDSGKNKISRVFMSLPVKTAGWWVEINRQTSEVFVGWLSGIISENE